MAEQSPSPTQDDVARAAHVSRSTVSRALTHHPSIPETTRSRICEVARRMGYRENPYVTANMQRVRRSRKSRALAVIAFLTPYNVERWYQNVLSYRKIYESARQRAFELGFELDPISLFDESITSRRCSDILIARGVDGILVGPFDNPFMRLKMDWTKFAVATLGFAHVKPRFSHAAANHYYNTCLVLRKLHRLGYQRIGLAIPARANRYAQGTFEAAYRLYSGSQPSENRIPHFSPGDLADWKKEAFLKWFGKARPEVVVCITKDIRFWLADAGVSIPDEVGLAFLSRHGDEKDWTGIDQHTELVGAAGIQIIAEQLMLNQRGQLEYPRTIFIEGEWKTGWTTRRLRGGSAS